MKSKLGFAHITALDFLRGIAVLCVALMHTKPSLLGSGFVGVIMFFALSGFLITTILLVEWRETDDINLKNFYWNRFVRLGPAVIAAIIAFTLYNAWSRGTVEFLSGPTQHALSALFYYANWFQTYTTSYDQKLVPLWSLSVEEQFYFVWPLTLLIIAKNKTPGWLRLALLMAGLLLPLVFRIYRIDPAIHPFSFYFRTETWIDSLFWGIATALFLHYRPDLAKRHRVNIQRAAIVGCAVIAWHAMQPNMLFNYWIYRGGFALIALCTSCIVAAAVVTPLPSAMSLPEAIRAPVVVLGRFLVWTGTISYSLYIWNQALVFMVDEQFPALGYWQLPLVIALNFAVAAISFYGLERPLRRLLKDRFRDSTNANVDRATTSTAIPIGQSSS